jgi:hypothetical protein
MSSTIVLTHIFRVDFYFEFFAIHPDTAFKIESGGNELHR